MVSDINPSFSEATVRHASVLAEVILDHIDIAHLANSDFIFLLNQGIFMRLNSQLLNTAW